jgi:heme exporter protein A
LRLIAENLELIRNERQLFSGLNFSLGSGEALLLTGPNGSGKSSLLRALLGFLPFTTGKLSLEGPNDRTLAETAHYLGHSNGLKSALTAGENLDFWAKMLQLEVENSQKAKISPKEALAALKLAHIEHVPVAYLSAGQRRRVALARLLVATRPLWLLDEPTTALDSATVLLFADLCKSHLAQGGMILAATHLDMGLEARRIELGGVS